MAKYLLDTTVLIDHLHGLPGVVELLARLAVEGHQLGICCVNVAELYSGLAERQKEKADRLIGWLDYIDITAEAAKLAGSYRSAFAAKGVAIHTADTLVAAAAARHGAILVTANVKHYPMAGIEVLQQPRQ